MTIGAMANISVADPGGFLGFLGNPLFVVLRACAAGLVRTHTSAVENVLDSGTPL